MMGQVEDACFRLLANRDVFMERNEMRDLPAVVAQGS